MPPIPQGGHPLWPATDQERISPYEERDTQGQEAQRALKYALRHGPRYPPHLHRRWEDGDNGDENNEHYDSEDPITEASIFIDAVTNSGPRGQECPRGQPGAYLLAENEEQEGARSARRHQNFTLHVHEVIHPTSQWAPWVGRPRYQRVSIASFSCQPPRRGRVLSRQSL